jgi:hypothetical protein
MSTGGFKFIKRSTEIVYATRCDHRPPGADRLHRTQDGQAHSAQGKDLGETSSKQLWRLYELRLSDWCSADFVKRASLNSM